MIRDEEPLSCTDSASSFLPKDASISRRYHAVSRLTKDGWLSAVAISGCSGSGGGGSSSGGSAEQQEEEDCRTVERTREENLADELETVSAGSTWTWRFDLEEGQRLIISARLVEGARPAVEVESPNGTTVLDVGPKERIQRTVTAYENGRYYIKFENEALVTSGQWDVQIDWEEEYEDEICN